MMKQNNRWDPSNINIDEEYELIQKKVSKLSSKQRAYVVYRKFRKSKNTTSSI